MPKLANHSTSETLRMFFFLVEISLQVLAKIFFFFSFFFFPFFRAQHPSQLLMLVKIKLKVELILLMGELKNRV